MTKKYFVAGTDTSIGKTYVAVGLLQLFNQLGLSTLGIKPVASGSIIKSPQGTGNNDALALKDSSSIKLPYELINPFLFQEPIAPNIAAQREGVSLSVNGLTVACQPALTTPADVIIIEGCGGWCVPLNSKETMADFAKALQIPVILVVGIRLGCINHALLTMQSILAQGAKLQGWIANCFDPTAMVLDENIQTLNSLMPIPLIGVISRHQKPETCLNTQFLL